MVRVAFVVRTRNDVTAMVIVAVGYGMSTA
jgi:hypothetical protein